MTWLFAAFVVLFVIQAVFALAADAQAAAVGALVGAAICAWVAMPAKERTHA